MALITTDSGICLSPSGVTVYPNCGDIIRENGEQYIQTETERNLMVDGGCADPAIPSFYCDIERKTIDSGKFVTLVNTCSLPFTVTGFRNSDPIRFSIFKAENYQNVYSSGNTTQLPFTLKPFRSINIPTFFHPLRSELETGKAGTYEDATGDSFSGRIDIYPGIPIVNCSTDELSCDSYFTLSGQLICESLDLPEFLSNDENFITPSTGEIEKINSFSCLDSTSIMGYNSSDNTVSVQNQYKAISGAVGFFPTFLGEEWLESYNFGVTGALGAFNRIVTGIIGSGLDNNINNLLSAQIDRYKVGSSISGSYRNGDSQTIDIDGRTYTGMNFSVVSDVVADTRNQTVFFDANIIPGSQDDARIFIADSGDFSQQPLCEVNA